LPHPIAGDRGMTRGHDDWLSLSCEKLPFSTLYRFSSALSQRPCSEKRLLILRDGFFDYFYDKDSAMMTSVTTRANPYLQPFRFRFQVSVPCQMFFEFSGVNLT
ncbi:MAG: hypothetical protein C1942_10050, partial [Prosthecochloris sp.]|nr:hypothetical protein [Prosthecochloris sp.]